MAYETSNSPKCLVVGIGSGPSIWVYTDGDAHADVDAAGYFTNAGKLGMKVGDIVYVQNTTGYTTTLHSVSAVSNGAATISAAVLA